MMGPRFSILLVALFGSASAQRTCDNEQAKLIRRNTLSCGNKQFIVDFHNKIRNHVASGRIDGQPKAADMIELRWNESLAKLAQKRADTCMFDHGDLELNGKRVGQNLALITSTVNNLRLNMTQMINLWYNEVFQFGYNGGFDPNSGHYSQLIWGNTREVGCGFSYYEEDNWYKMYFVCDYYPPGNYINQKPYSYGKYNCKAHGLLESKKYSKLCTIDNIDSTVCKAESSKGHGSGNRLKTKAEDKETPSDDPQSAVTELTMMGEDTEPTVTASSEEATTSAETSDYDSTVRSDESDTTLLSTMLNGMGGRPTNKHSDDKGQTVLILSCNKSTPPETNWKNRDEFFTAATKLLDLLVTRRLQFKTTDV